MECILVLFGLSFSLQASSMRATLEPWMHVYVSWSMFGETVRLSWSVCECCRIFLSFHQVGTTILWFWFRASLAVLWWFKSWCYKEHMVTPPPRLHLHDVQQSGEESVIILLSSFSIAWSKCSVWTKKKSKVCSLTSKSCLLVSWVPVAANINCGGLNKVYSLWGRPTVSLLRARSQTHKPGQNKWLHNEVTCVCFLNGDVLIYFSTKRKNLPVLVA